jgi:hypothetical protein
MRPRISEGVREKLAAAVDVEIESAVDVDQLDTEAQLEVLLEAWAEWKRRENERTNASGVGFQTWHPPWEEQG